MEARHHQVTHGAETGGMLAASSMEGMPLKRGRTDGDAESCDAWACEETKAGDLVSELGWLSSDSTHGGERSSCFACMQR